jgi:putative phage-type endonuclease
MLTKEQLTKKTNYIGGSEAAAVLGLSRWDTPLSVWARLTGALPREEKEGLHLTLGNRLEEVVAELFTQQTGKKVQRVNETRFHKHYPYLGANLDRRIVGEDAILECKTASAWKAKEWQDEDIPQEYVLQVVHYLAVTGAQKGYLAVLIGNQDFKVKEILRDEALINDLVRKESDFWTRFVVPKVMPGIGMITTRDADTLYSLYPVADPGSVVHLTDDANKIIETRNAYIQDIKNLEAQTERMENELKLLLGAKEYGQTDQWVISWKNQSSRRLDTGLLKAEKPELYERYLREIASRVLRIKGAKP